MADATGKISDGHHTFDELYEHRVALFGALVGIVGGWKSKRHGDGTPMYDGWFVAGTNGENPITYHLPMSDWDAFPAEELDEAPAFDGHTPAMVVERLRKSWARRKYSVAGIIEDMVRGELKARSKRYDRDTLKFFRNNDALYQSLGHVEEGFVDGFIRGAKAVTIKMDTEGVTCLEK